VPVSAIVALGLLAAVLAAMAGEAVLSAHNAAILRARGAVEPPDDVYRAMQWAYPGGFVAIAIEGAIVGPAPVWALAAGLSIFGLAKALKAWAIAALGWRWTYRVLVPPSAPLVAAGPYRFIRHPNYVAVCGEILGAALLAGAPVTGTAFLAGFAVLLRRRIAVEDHALGRT
jgi:methyltransferase